MQIKDAVGNEYGRAKDIAGEKRTVFTSHADAAFDICFENNLAHRGGADSFRHVELDVDIGADAKDWAAIQANEKLKPVETELRRIEEMLNEVVGEMEYLRLREQKLRDTNESTNTRVKWFGFGTTFLLIGLWGWQIMYLRAYFRCVSSFARILMLPHSPANPYPLQLQASYLDSQPTTQLQTRLFTFAGFTSGTHIYTLHLYLLLSNLYTKISHPRHPRMLGGNGLVQKYIVH